MDFSSIKMRDDFSEGEFAYENISGAREEEIRSRLDDARDALDAMPESELLRARLENITLELEVYRNEHDNTGSYKFKRFGKEMRGLFSEDIDGSSPKIEKAGDGSFKLPRSMEKRRMIFIDMLELDRLNKEGGSHDVGDLGLVRASELIRTIASKYGDFELFRSGGNQFMLDIREIRDEDRDALVSELSTIRVSAKEGIEPAPLVANGIDFASAVEDLNLLQTEIGSFGDLEPYEASRELTGILMRSGEWGSEIKKRIKRANRVREMLEHHPERAEEFFNNYARKAFSETPYKTLDDFKHLIDNGTFDSEMRNLAFNDARSRFELKRGQEALTDEEAHHIARSKVVWERVEAHSSRRKDGVKRREFAEIPRETRGESVLREMREALASAEAVMEEDPTPMNDAVRTRRRLELELEEARRDVGTGLLERGIYYEDLEEDLDKEEPIMVIFVDMGFLKYFDKQGGRDVGNNALRLAASLMEDALDDAGVDGRAYRYGGDEFTVRIKGDAGDVKNFLDSLEDLNDVVGVVPPGKKSKHDYVPTKLQFSHAVADLESMERLARRSKRPLSLNEKAKLMTQIADAGVEYLKASDRFEYLLAQMENPEFHDRKFEKNGNENGYTAQVESKITYSNKALFSELGGETVLRVFAEEIRNMEKLPKEEREELREEIEWQIRRFVLDRVDVAREKRADNKTLLDRLVEMRAKVNYLEGELASIRAMERAGSERIRALEDEKLKTERDMAEMMSLRGQFHA